MSRLRVAVIGGGAAGIFAALAASGDAEVTIYEKNDRVGKKILSTGNGRCNLSNTDANMSNYHGADVEFIKYVADSFWVEETLESFSRMGLLYKVEEGGKVFPYSNSAASVLDVLRSALERKNVSFEYGFEVRDVSKRNGVFLLTSYDGKTAEADRAVVTTGGKACPSSGSNGSGYAILQSFGHRITEIFPSLVQIKLKNDVLKPLNGLKINGTISVKSGKETVRRETGEILFTDYGFSGPAAFAVSRVVGEKRHCVAGIDMMPEYGYSEICEMLCRARKIMTEAEELFKGIMQKRIGQLMIKNVLGIKMNSDIKQITDSDIKRIAAKVKNFEVETDGTMSWNNAQVTAGGALTEQFDKKTMQSKLVSGLYAAGEVLDIDGDCGGYNLQWAWASGYTAGKNAAKER